MDKIEAGKPEIKCDILPNLFNSFGHIFYNNPMNLYLIVLTPTDLHPRKNRKIDFPHFHPN